MFQRSTQSRATQGLYVFALRTGSIRLLVATWLGENPAWSPDGKLIAFDDETDIFVVKVDGTGLHRITHHKPGDYGDFDPAWSPDGRRIAFTHAGSLMVMNADGTGRRSLRVFKNGPYNSPAWSPDGREIMVTYAPTCLENGNNVDGTKCYLGDLYIIHPDGTGFRQITFDHKRWQGSWSPSGQHIVFEYGTQESRSVVGIMDANGSGFHQVPSTTLSFGVTWHISA